MLLAFAIGAWFVLSIVSGPFVGQLLRAREPLPLDADPELAEGRAPPAHPRRR